MLGHRWVIPFHRNILMELYIQSLIFSYSMHAKDALELNDSLNFFLSKCIVPYCTT